MKILTVVTLFLLLAILGDSFVSRAPLLFIVDRTANQFATSQHEIKQHIGRWLIHQQLAEDWRQPGQDVAVRSPYPLLNTAANSSLTYPYQTYTGSGQPDGLFPQKFAPPPEARQVGVNSPTQLRRAIHQALPGDIITIAPGKYPLGQQTLTSATGGTATAPVYVRANRFGDVELQVQHTEGFRISSPYWVFENLKISGVCATHSQCEHALHIVGKGRSFTLRNSEIVNFNAAIKVNLTPQQGHNLYPDLGLLEYNSIYNETRRATRSPVTPVNIDAASGWVVRGNYIADFAKAGGNKVSYGGFMKGNGQNGLIERNLVMCEHQLAADSGIRIGLSLGGGGMHDPIFCRDNSCSREHSSGTIRNNIILNCSRDVGLYLNRSAGTNIEHNLLYNTLGIDVRYSASSAIIRNNIVSARIKDREGGQSTRIDNLVYRNCLGRSRSGCYLNQAFRNPDSADFRRGISATTPIGDGKARPQIFAAFCGHPPHKSGDHGGRPGPDKLSCLTSATPK